MRDYPMIISPLSEDEGGGYKVEFPDLPGCIADGETPHDAALNGQDALRAWLEVRAEIGGAIPEPGSSRLRVRAMRDQLLAKLQALAAIQARNSASWENVSQDLARSQEDLNRLETEMDEQRRLLEALKDHLGLEDWDDLPLAVGAR